MTPAQLDIARRLVAQEWFEWAGGMKPWHPTASNYHRCVVGRNGHGEDQPHMGVEYLDEAPAWGWPAKGSGWLPDLTDGATGGVLLGMLFAMPLDVDLLTSARSDGTRIYTVTIDGKNYPPGWTPAEAAALALLAVRGE